MQSPSLYEFTMPGGSHWSLRVRRGLSLRLTAQQNSANVGMIFYNPENLLEKYNAPDTLKCQHTFKLTQGHCLYSDMGRIFCSIVEDTYGWHDTVCGNSDAPMVEKKWGKRDYQSMRNEWFQNGHDSFMVEIAKYGLGIKDLAANVNWFSKVAVMDDGQLLLDDAEPTTGKFVTLRFELDTLVVFHTCPHPLSKQSIYPRTSIKIEMFKSDIVTEIDLCKTACEENKRGFENNRLYLGEI